MTIVNGTFDTSLSGWTTSTTLNGTVTQWSGYARLFVNADCGSATMQQTFMIDGPSLSFYRNLRTGQVGALPNWKLIVDGNVVLSDSWPLCYGCTGQATETRDVSAYLGKTATIIFNISPSPCSSADTRLLVDNVTNSATTGNASFTSTPSSARIWIDNVDKGVNTPNTITVIKRTEKERASYMDL